MASFPDFYRRQSIFLFFNTTNTIGDTPQESYEGEYLMKLNKIKFIEKFILVTFPVALAVGCTTTNDQQGKSAAVAETTQNQSYALTQPVHRETNQAGSAVINIPHAGDTMNAHSHTAAAYSNTATVVDNAHTVYKDDSLEVKVRLSGTQDMKTTAKTIFQFAVNQYDLNGADLEVLRQHAHFLKTHSNLTLYVDGFSDNRGSALSNYKLSKKRALHVAELLKSYGAPQSQIKVNGYGESFPLNSEKNWDENRRVELEYVEAVSQLASAGESR
jgi:peptidoglycan-associated lipoprotein